MQTLRTSEFEIGLLAGWRDASQIVLIGPERIGFTPNVQIHREQIADEPLDQYFRAQRAELGSLDGFELINHGDRILAGRRALYHSYAWNLPDQPGKRLRQMQVASVHGSIICTITASALQNDWDDVEASLEQMIAGIRWT